MTVRRDAMSGQEPAAPAIVGSSDRLKDQQKAAGIVLEDTASALFGVQGLQVTDVEAAPDGGIEVWVVTACAAAAACPDCGTASDRVHETVVTRPRDVRRAGDAVDLRWVKYRRKCANRQCPRKTFTESVPALPPRCRNTARLREQAAHEIAGTPASSIWTASRGCLARSRAGPPTTPRTGWPAPPPRGETPSGSSASTCAASTPQRPAGCCRTRP
jgi:hypothetical protein